MGMRRKSADARQGRGRRNLFAALAAAAALCQGHGAAAAETALHTSAGAQSALWPPAVNTGAEWRIYHAEWSAEHEAGFEAFVRALGRSECQTFDACLESEANPYRHTDDFGSFQGDCADLPYFLRAYYAWKNGLPFSYQDLVETADGSAVDERYSAKGNVVASRYSAATPEDGPPVDAPQYLREIHRRVSTAMFRTHPVTGGGDLFDDFYPIEISRQAIRPGVLAYDVFGHAGIVYDVTDDGRILLMASHPNYAITRTVYGQNFQRAHPDLGAGLKAWRPQRLVGAAEDDSGALVGGVLVAAADAELPDFSLEQHFGSNAAGAWSEARFIMNGVALPYYDYVRRTVAKPGFAYNPVAEVRRSADSICRSVEARARAVERTLEAGLASRPHPERLPANIFGASGEWERHATPARDARLKIQFVELRELVGFFLSAHAAGDGSVAYRGADLPGDLLRAYDEAAAACVIDYRRSDGETARLTLHDVAGRLFDLSFNPYQCTERRWGARGRELSACPDDAVKRDWYEALAYLRNQTARDLSLRTDFSLDEIKPPHSASAEEGGLGWPEPPDADVRGFLAARAAPSGADLSN